MPNKIQPELLTAAFLPGKPQQYTIDGSSSSKKNYYIIDAN